MKLYSLLALALLVIYPGRTFAQKYADEIKIKRNELKTGQTDGLQDAWLAVVEADEFFARGTGSYDLAREKYLQAHQYNSENPELNFKIGVCYLYTEDKYMAVQYLRKAYDKKPKISPEIQYLLGKAYHYSLEFDKAIESYFAYRASLGPQEAVKQYDAIDKLITECKNGKALVADRKRVIITNLGDSINSRYDDYFCILTRNDSLMYFTSRRPVNTKSKRNPFDDKYYEDVYSSRQVSGKWSGAKPVGKQINSKSNDAAVGFHPLLNQLFIYRGKDNGGDVMVSEYKKGEWKSPGSWESKFSSDQSESSVFFSLSGDTVYFISANEDLTNGGRDILMAVKDRKGKWMKPVNLSSIVNTKYDEEGVFLTPDGNTLYFSSKGHNTMGGFDVFKTQRQPTGLWSDPENLGYPVNSPDDDLFFILQSNGSSALISSVRDGGLGGKDIYKLIFLGSEKELLLANEDIMVSWSDKAPKNGFFTLPEPVGIDSFYYLKGKVLNKNTNEPVIARLEFVDSTESKVVATVVSSETGDYMAKFLAPKKYDVEIVAKDYLFFLDEVDLSSATTDEPFIVDFQVEKLEVGAKVVLENINFETSKATLTPASYPKLDRIVQFLKDNSTLKVEISGHTDNVGSSKTNLKLSEDRAKAVVNYMVSSGIDATRLESKGYGFSQPVAPNNTPEGRELNRRVEFKITSK